MQVEDTIFRIPREYLSQESTIFCDMLQIPQPTDGDCDGSADAKPIQLPQIAATSFRLLLRFLFNLERCVSQLIKWEFFLENIFWGADPHDRLFPKRT